MRYFFLVIAILFCCQCSHIKQTQTITTNNAIPSVHVTTDSGKRDLKISNLKVEVKVVGNIATTTFELTFFNSLNRILEGELDFPLADGQTITRYALEINGLLREGVVVEKAKARVAFENITRRGIDPGLVEKTSGNNFRTRVYPIPANGYKKISISVQQKLSASNERLVYQLPLEAKESIDTISIRGEVKSKHQPIVDNSFFSDFAFKEIENAFTGNTYKNNFVGKQVFSFQIPFEKNEANVYTETIKGKTYFYIDQPIDILPMQKAKPSSIGILWDISGSTKNRNIEKEIALIDKYISSLANVKILLIPFNIKTLPAQEFTDLPSLLSSLRSFDFDGGTQLGAIELTKYDVQEFLLFSDGLSTFGKKEMVLAHKPITTISSSTSADFSCLKFLATETSGQFIDLTKQETNSAVESLNYTTTKVLDVKTETGSIENYTTDIDVVNNRFSIAGVLNSNEAIVAVSFSNTNHDSIVRHYSVSQNETDEISGIGRIWAAMKIDKLDLLFDKNKEEITTLGKAFSIVTRNTSLLVLDRAEDYVEYKIVPPAELQKEYFALLKQKANEPQDDGQQGIEEAVQAMKERKEWWAKDFTGPSKTSEFKVSNGIYMDSNITSQNEVGPSSLSYSVSPNAQVRTDSTSAGWYNNQTPQLAEVQIQRLSVHNSYKTDDILEGDKKSSIEHDGTKSNIEIKQIEKNTGYSKILDNTPVEESWIKYLQLKKIHGEEPSFFMDAATWFFAKGKKETALLVLSNLAEMKLENAVLLRSMAYQLVDMQEKELAIETFRELLKMREEEPQSYRDLSLALNDGGYCQQAIDNLYKVITTVWDSRFEGVKIIAINEMNNIIAAHKKEINTAAIDKRLIDNMPVDVRIVIDWNTNDTDVDLWVTDPKKEKCFYQNKQTGIGGHITDDMTQGYGPEEFEIKKASAGKYVVEANLYGDHRQTITGGITIRADLYTDFGKPTQKHKTINFRVTDNKEVVQVGELQFNL